MLDELTHIQSWDFCVRWSNVITIPPDHDQRAVTVDHLPTANNRPTPACGERQVSRSQSLVVLVPPKIPILAIYQSNREVAKRSYSLLDDVTAVGELLNG